jgi:ribose/xylose/arabinose/galactoside ABC-type transport system permease subunit
VLLAWAGSLGGRILPWLSGLDPTVPAFTPTDRLFGPRSSRAFGAAAAIPIASWVSFNVPVGQITTAVQGLLFPVAYVWTCGVVRLLVARTLADLAVGVAMVSVATGTAWLLRSGSDSFPGAVLACAVAPLAAFLAGWLNGRGRRRAQPRVEAEA